MPIHDWTRVKAGIFHDFHHEWILSIKHALNDGALSSEYYAMVERIFEWTEADHYAGLPKSVVIRHVTNHRVISVVEIVSPGKKSDNASLAEFVNKARETLLAGIHLLIIDLFPPTVCVPKGIHCEIVTETKFESEKPLTCISYVAEPNRSALIEPIEVGDMLPVMPVFLSESMHVSLALEPTYQAAWKKVPLPTWVALAGRDLMHALAAGQRPQKVAKT